MRPTPTPNVDDKQKGKKWQRICLSRGKGANSKLTGVGHRDLINLIGVEPNLVAAALHDGGRKTLLQLQGQHDEWYGGTLIGRGSDD